MSQTVHTGTCTTLDGKQNMMKPFSFELRIQYSPTHAKQILLPIRFAHKPKNKTTHKPQKQTTLQSMAFEVSWCSKFGHPRKDGGQKDAPLNWSDQCKPISVTVVPRLRATHRYEEHSNRLGACNWRTRNTIVCKGTSSADLVPYLCRIEVNKN